MSSGMPELNEPGRETCCRVAWQAFGILLAAVALGITYNESSPLGVHKPTAEELPLPPILNRSTNAAPPPSAASANSRTGPAAGSEGPLTNIPSWNFSPPAASGTPAPATSTSELQFPELKWPAVKALLATKQIILIDARLAETYALSRIPGAVSLPAYSPAEQLQLFAAKYPRDTRFVIYCNSVTCDMSHDLAGKLKRQFGYTNLALMPGGFAEYVIAEPGTANPTP